jgi:hypothetical protein
MDDHSRLDGSPLSCGIIARSAGLFENSSKRFCACDGVAIWDERDVPAAGEGRSSSLEGGSSSSANANSSSTTSAK